VLDLLLGGAIGGSRKGSFQCVLLLFLDKPADIIDGKALQGVVLVELEVVQFVESCTCLSSSPVGHVEGLIADSVLATDLDSQ
jgi:hypothetical protein